MSLKKVLQLLSVALILLSCFKPYPGDDDRGFSYPPRPREWGYKPVYATESNAKAISYFSVPQPVVSAGNIYAYQHYIFQIDPGYGIHVIDNSIPSAASRIGFITVKGCSQISIKNNKIYTNSYDDLLVLEFSDLNNVHEYSRLKGVFPELRYWSPLAQPPATGYYECPNYGSLVIDWVRDSVSHYSCFKQ